MTFETLELGTDSQSSSPLEWQICRFVAGLMLMGIGTLLLSKMLLAAAVLMGLGFLCVAASFDRLFLDRYLAYRPDEQALWIYRGHLRLPFQRETAVPINTIQFELRETGGKGHCGKKSHYCFGFQLITGEWVHIRHFETALTAQDIETLRAFELMHHCVIANLAAHTAA